MLVGALLLSGCVGAHGRLGGHPAPGDNGAEIVVIREWRFIGSGARVQVLVGGEPIYGLATSEHASFRLPPGEWIIGATSSVPLTVSTAVTVRAEAGQRYYFLIEPGGGFCPEFVLHPLPPGDAEQLMEKTARVQ